jgi:hypothetical protein
MLSKAKAAVTDAGRTVQTTAVVAMVALVVAVVALVVAVSQIRGGVA